MNHEWGNLKKSADLRKGILDALDRIENVKQISIQYDKKGQVIHTQNHDITGRGVAEEIDPNTLQQNITELKKRVNAYISGVIDYSEKTFGKNNTKS